ncbi:glycosyl hydrolase [Aquabacterium sp. A7-Y]|uniref:glycosyl hydrolase n=1 Tax=Aquabacterium sp. A7-Y TaxID=1349605 RepID=UPI00223D4AF1|nr:glycosyl hydrolase [Aquabacterium sp. A7-Y]MCW7540859.1 glycosyl hydrolase [Aquabacterium sp. A7-Y]
MAFLPRAALAVLALSLSAAAFGQTRFKSLNYLYSISGQKTVAGQHNREPNSDPARWTERIKETTGRYPGLWGGDFLFSGDDIAHRATMIAQARQQWSQGALVNIMWHTCSPAKAEPCGWNTEGVHHKLSDAEWEQLFSEGSWLNQVLRSRLDDLAAHLQVLEDAGVEVLFRPFHEMNQPVFWWAGRPGPNGTPRLYRYVHDYLTKRKGLSNLVWVWNVQDFATLREDLVRYNPGNDYWDLLSLDVYGTDGRGYTQDKYDALVAASGGKPIAIGEMQRLPTPQELAAQPRWTFFMGWAELVFEKNSSWEIQNTFQHDRVLTRDEMPGWGGDAGAGNLARGRPVTVSSTEPGYPGANAVDGQTESRWSSDYADRQHLYVDLGSERRIRRVRVVWETAYARYFQVQTSSDGRSWKTIWEKGNNTSLTNDITGLGASARYVKIYGVERATQWGFSIRELEVY